MITKRELLMRIINLEDLYHDSEDRFKKLERQIKKLEKPAKEK